MNKLNVLYEDNHIIVALKKPNILSQSDITKDTDMLSLVKEYVKEKYNKPGNVYIGLVHRLDRPVGGIMVFARTSKAAKRLNEQIKNHEFNKTYIAVLDGHLENKTGELLKLSIRMGAILADASENDIERLSKFADKIGLAFQIKDDILSEEGNPEVTGKPVGNDKEHNKCTYVSVFGIEGAKKELEKITNEAVEILEYYGDKAEFLKKLAIYIKDRNK